MTGTSQFLVGRNDLAPVISAYIKVKSMGLHVDVQPTLCQGPYMAIIILA